MGGWGLGRAKDTPWNEFGTAKGKEGGEKGDGLHKGEKEKERERIRVSKPVWISQTLSSYGRVHSCLTLCSDHVPSFWEYMDSSRAWIFLSSKPLG